MQRPGEEKKLDQRSRNFSTFWFALFEFSDQHNIIRKLFLEIVTIEFSRI